MTFDGRWEAAITIAANTIVATATNSGGGPSNITVLAGTYSGPTALLAHFVAQLNATRVPATWSGSISIGRTGTGQVTINWTGSGNYTITWVVTSFRDLLGFTGAAIGPTAAGVASVSPKQVRGMWIPDCPLVADHDPTAAPPETDRRSVGTPNGVVYTHVGNKMYRHKNLTYSHVPKAKIWEADAAIGNASIETFWNDAQLGLGLSYFAAGAKLLIYDMNGVAVGIKANGGAGVAGWYVAAPRELTDMLSLPAKPWTGLYQVAIGDITTDA